MSGFIKFFRGASPYINRHRGKTFVLAFSGEAVAHANFTNIIQDIALLQNLGVRLVLVHGTRTQLSARLEQAGVNTDFQQNLRITGTEAMECAREVAGGVRIAIESQLSTDLANSPMAGAGIRVAGGNFITARPVGIRNGHDFAHTGTVRRIDKTAIQQQLNNGSVVLLSPIGYSPTGEAFNLSYQEIAAQTAIGLGADKLMMFTAEQGVVTADGLTKALALNEVPQLLLDDAVNDTLKASLKACHEAGLAGVPRSHIVSHASDGTLLTELFTVEGAGTLILENREETIRQASIDDVGGILELITPLEERDILVKRSRELLETEISNFYVMVHSEANLVACAALYPFPAEDDGESGSAELACVATHRDFRNRGFAARLLGQVEKQARAAGINQLFALTTQTSHWFQEQGFVASDVTQLPKEKQSLYNWQRNSKVFRKPL